MPVINGSFWISNNNAASMIVVYHTDTPCVYHVIEVGNTKNAWSVDYNSLIADYDMMA